MSSDQQRMEQAQEEYLKAQRNGQKEHRELTQQGLNPEPAVLDDLLDENPTNTIHNLGLIDIPTDRIIGTKTRGRTAAFSRGFLPILPRTSEFAHKWMSLCAAHLSDEGIQDPIECFEYLGDFYVQEGNKRVSVLKHFGGSSISGMVKRVMPIPSDEPRVQAYMEFVEFFGCTQLYDVQFHTPGSYAKLLSHLGKQPGEKWSQREQRTFRAYFQYFKDAFFSVMGNADRSLRPEDALLAWLEVHPFLELGKMSSGAIRRSVLALKGDITAMTQDSVLLQTEPEESKPGLLSSLLNIPPSHVQVAFVHQLDTKTSNWCEGHVEGSQYLKQVLGKQVTVRHYYNANTNDLAEALLQQAVEEGAQVVFTSTPKLGRPTLKAAVQYPKVRFFNCAVDIPYSSVHCYYGRIFEGKFITGAIAGAMANNDRIGYVGSYPTFGVPASINAFALGAQLTNPRAKIELRWSCLPGTPVQDFIAQGMQVISNKDLPTAKHDQEDHGSYGTYHVTENGELVPMGSPIWLWGPFYEKVVRSILNGTWDSGKENQAVNYWWGMDSGVIDVKFSDKLPEGVRALAEVLRQGLRNGTIDPFRRRLVAQDGRLISDGSRALSMEELLHMDWLCENVIGEIPPFDQILPIAQPMVRFLGIYRDQIPPETEGSL